MSRHANAFSFGSYEYSIYLRKLQLLNHLTADNNTKPVKSEKPYNEDISIKSKSRRNRTTNIISNSHSNMSENNSNKSELIADLDNPKLFWSLPRISVKDQSYLSNSKKKQYDPSLWRRSHKRLTEFILSHLWAPENINHACDFFFDPLAKETNIASYVAGNSTTTQNTEEDNRVFAAYMKMLREEEEEEEGEVLANSREFQLYENFHQMNAMEEETVALLDSLNLNDSSPTFGENPKFNYELPLGWPQEEDDSWRNQHMKAFQEDDDNDNDSDTNASSSLPHWNFSSPHFNLNDQEQDKLSSNEIGNDPWIGSDISENTKNSSNQEGNFILFLMHFRDLS